LVCDDEDERELLSSAGTQTSSLPLVWRAISEEEEEEEV
jgi:hypothetical protein